MPPISFLVTFSRARSETRKKEDRLLEMGPNTEEKQKSQINRSVPGLENNQPRRSRREKSGGKEISRT